MTKIDQFLSVLCLCASLVVPCHAIYPTWNTSIIAHTGEPIGKEVQYNNLTLYVTGRPSDTAVLYLTDVFGIQLPENKLLADSFGRAGYLTIAPDMFNGKPAPSDLDDPSFNLTGFLEQNRPGVIDPLLENTVNFIREKLSIDSVVVTGYCFGGRYSFRLLSEGRQVTAGFAAHPSLLEDDEIAAITGAVSVAAAEHDDLLPAERRHKIEQQLFNKTQAYSIALYSGTQHGFGVRANVSDPKQKFAKEEAFFQAVRWFDAWA